MLMSKGEEYWLYNQLILKGEEGRKYKQVIVVTTH